MELAEKPYFVCCDKKLLRIATGKGLSVINPENP